MAKDSVEFFFSISPMQVEQNYKQQSTKTGQNHNMISGGPDKKIFELPKRKHDCAYLSADLEESM